jgi:SH3 domain-containing protein
VSSSPSEGSEGGRTGKADEKMVVGSRRSGRGRRGLSIGALVVLAGWGAGCAAKATVPVPPQPPPVVETPAPVVDTAADDLRQELDHAREESARLREQLKAAQRETALAQEQREALRSDMKRVLDDVLASKAAASGVQNRALAISRIAEVRVQMQNVPGHREPEVAARLRSADDLLAQADLSLDKGNFGGASYLADRAGDLVQQARAVAAVGARPSGIDSAGIVRIVPPRTLSVTVAANLRKGPDSALERVAGAKPGAQLTAVARLGDWFQVETGAGQLAWIHRATVR